MQLTITRIIKLNDVLVKNILQNPFAEEEEEEEGGSEHNTVEYIDTQFAVIYCLMAESMNELISSSFINYNTGIQPIFNPPPEVNL